MPDDREVAVIFTKYFSTITESTDTPKYDPIDNKMSEHNGLCLKSN